MKHLIIVKWNDRATDRAALESEARALFEEALAIPGVHGVKVIPGITERANRFDLMIEMDMDARALPAYDQSEPHRLWKENYGGFIERKTIFDYDPPGADT